MNLSKNLTLAEVTISESAKRNGIYNNPTEAHKEALKLIAIKIFQPLREHFNVPIFISSGYRSEALNKLIGGSKTSQHSKGEALDIDMDGRADGVSNKDIFNYIKECLPFDQLIWEFGTEENPDWVHVSYSATRQRNEVLIATRVNGKVSYCLINEF